MAGHSKWANIRHRKAAQDAKRGKLFTKLIREIVVAARQGGPEPQDNPRLRAAMDKALSANMTRDTIDRAISRGAGNDDNDNVEELTYEGYGPGGVAMLLEVMTDNRNRTVAAVRNAFAKAGGNLGTDGSVAYLFNKVGQFTFDADADEERILEVALDAGAEDLVTHEDGSLEVLAPPAAFGAVRDALDAADLSPVSAEVVMRPDTTVPLDADGADKNLRLLDVLEDLDDVQNVWCNADFPDEALARWSG